MLDLRTDQAAIRESVAAVCDVLGDDLKLPPQLERTAAEIAALAPSIGQHADGVLAGSVSVRRRSRSCARFA
jgi:hypothetical protein